MKTDEAERLFDKALRQGRWVAFGYPPEGGRRVRIEEPWRPELKFDEKGNMWDGNQCFTDVRFYEVAEHKRTERKG